MLLRTAMYPQSYPFDDACDRLYPRTPRSEDALLPMNAPAMSFRSIIAQNGGHIMTKVKIVRGKWFIGPTPSAIFGLQKLRSSSVRCPHPKYPQ